MERAKYKYIHILNTTITGWIFIQNLLEVLNSEKNGFEIDEQLFVTADVPLYQKMKEQGYSNVCLRTEKRKNSVNMINDFGDKCDWMFVHGMTSVIESIKIKPRYRAKIIWRTWGHETGYRYTDNWLKNIPKYFLNMMYRHVVRSFYAVGAGNSTVDKIEIRKRFGDVKIIPISYSSPSRNNSLEKVLLEPETKEKCFNIMLGHSGHPQENHIQILKILERFINQDIDIYIPLVYGDKEYIKSLIQYIEDSPCKEKITIIQKLVPFEEYARFIKKMDLAILDGLGSAALGNIDLLKRFRKKICVNRNGVVHQAMEEDGIPHILIDELKSISFQELSEPVEAKYPPRKKRLGSIESWHNVYNMLEKDSATKSSL